MTDYAHVAGDRRGVEHRPALDDALLLKHTMRKAISTSPGAFLMTINDLEVKGPDYWDTEIGSSTWTVAQRGNEVIGLAVARQPDPGAEPGIDPADTRFIESVWVHPEFRGGRLAERLLKFLFAVEFGKNSDVRRFMLWVFEKNQSAIRLYERIGFAYVTRQNLRDWSGRVELQYEYRLEPGEGDIQAVVTAWRDDSCAEGPVCRVLGK